MPDAHPIATGARGRFANEQQLRCRPQTLWTYRQQRVRPRRQRCQRQSLGVLGLLLSAFPPALPPMLLATVCSSPCGRKRSLTYRALHFPHQLKNSSKIPVVQSPNPTDQHIGPCRLRWRRGRDQWTDSSLALQPESNVGPYRGSKVALYPDANCDRHLGTSSDSIAGSVADWMRGSNAGSQWELHADLQGVAKGSFSFDSHEL